MTYITIRVSGKNIAEVCGELQISGEYCFLSINPEQKVKAIKLVSLVPKAMYNLGKVCIPMDAVAYMSNNPTYNKASISLLEDDGKV